MISDRKADGVMGLIALGWLYSLIRVLLASEMFTLVKYTLLLMALTMVIWGES